jgi:hypothetical protein
MGDPAHFAEKENGSNPFAVVIMCRCVWEGVRCQSAATQEDGLCDWCSNARTEDQLRTNPKAAIAPDGRYLGLGGGGELHDSPLVYDDQQRIPVGKTAACWYPESGRTLANA